MESTNWLNSNGCSQWSQVRNEFVSWTNVTNNNFYKKRNRYSHISRSSTVDNSSKLIHWRRSIFFFVLRVSFIFSLLLSFSFALQLTQQKIVWQTAIRIVVHTWLYDIHEIHAAHNLIQFDLISFRIWTSLPVQNIILKKINKKHSNCYPTSQTSVYRLLQVSNNMCLVQMNHQSTNYWIINSSLTQEFPIHRLCAKRTKI